MHVITFQVAILMMLTMRITNTQRLTDITIPNTDALQMLAI